MGMESFGNQRDFASMSFDQLEADPVAGPVVQQVSLDWLKEYDRGLFDGQFEEELDSSGYLKLKDGGVSDLKPFHAISGDRDEVKHMIMNALRDK